VESVTLVCDGGNLKSYGRQGKLLWNYFARGRLGPFLSRSPEGTSYICGTNGNLIAVNRSGRELWRIRLEAPINFPVLIGWDGRIFVFTPGKVRCCTAAGYTLWSRDLGGTPAAAPQGDHRGGLVLAREDGEILEIDPFGGIQSRRVSAPPAVLVPLEAAGGGAPLLVLYKNGGAELSRRGGPPAALPSLGGTPLKGVSRGDTAAITLEDGRVVCLSPGEGRILWTGQSHVSPGTAAADLTMIYDERGIYVLSTAGATGIAGDGQRLWLIRLDGAAAGPAWGDEGILYSGGTDWLLYAYRLEEQVRLRKQSIYGPAPEGNYGTDSPPPSPWADDYPYFGEDGVSARLGEIREAIRRGETGTAEMAYTAYLMETAGSLGANPARDIRLYPSVQHRAEAVRLLAYIGSRETIPFLAGLLRRDPDSPVKAAAAEAIGRIGVDPEGAALRAFAALIFPPLPYRDEQTLTAVAAAAGSLCRFSGPPLSEAAVKILVALSGDDRPGAVRRRAQRELASLW
jgi:outer membrane protein assembly factor BamB